jgi:hypothetical protein
MLKYPLKTGLREIPYTVCYWKFLKENYSLADLCSYVKCIKSYLGLFLVVYKFCPQYAYEN